MLQPRQNHAGRKKKARSLRFLDGRLASAKPSAHGRRAPRRQTAGHLLSLKISLSELSGPALCHAASLVQVLPRPRVDGQQCWKKRARVRAAGARRGGGAGHSVNRRAAAAAWWWRARRGRVGWWRGVGRSALEAPLHPSSGSLRRAFRKHVV